VPSLVRVMGFCSEITAQHSADSVRVFTDLHGGQFQLIAASVGTSGTLPVGNVGPKVTTWRGVIWLRDSLLPGGRGREGQGLKYPSVGLGMI
jgi:hypothetical protein